MCAVATRTVDMLRFPVESYRTACIFQALERSALGAQIQLRRNTVVHSCEAEWLVLWGPGGRDRREAMDRQLARGGHVIALDLAYWNRFTKFRVSIDAAHPQAWVMRRDWPAARFAGDAAPVGDLWRSNGAILIAGVGAKAREQYGDQVTRWEQDMAAACRARWPDRRVVYRCKPPHNYVPAGLEPGANGPIEQTLRNVSLVITWHSNVAVDAIRLGIPVVCRDGAAAAVCPSELPDDPQPLDPRLRQRFLQNLAWFQWANHEAPQFWTFLAEILS